MPQTFTPQRLPDRGRIECHDCGANADVQLVPDGGEDGTGYRGDLALCRACLEKRTYGRE